MASPIRAGENGSGDGANAVGDAFRVFAQGLVQLQEALRLQKQEAERRLQEALRLQEERAATVLREMERKLQEKDEAIRALQQRLEETQGRGTALEERTTAPEGSGGEGGVRRLEGRVEKVETSLQRAVQTFMPRVEALLRLMEKPQSPRASLATAVSARKAASKRGAAAGGGEEPPSPSSTPTSSGAGHQGAASEEEERARQRVELRVREVALRMEEAENSPSPLGEQLCKAACSGDISRVQYFIDSGADVNYTDRHGATPLINAALKENVGVMLLLLQRGADANAVNCSGESALHWIVIMDYSGLWVYQLMVAGADVNARDKNGETPLHYAAMGGNEEAVRALLAAGARRDLRAWGGCWENKTPFGVATSVAVKDLLRG